MPGVSQIGRLRNKVTFKTTTLSADSYGGFTKANNSYFTAFAEIKPNNIVSMFKQITAGPIIGNAVESCSLLVSTAPIIIAVINRTDAIFTGLSICFAKSCL